MQVLVLGARRYDFKDDDGARVEGVTVHYLTVDPEDEGSPGDENQKGEIPFSVSAPASVFHQFEQLPGYYEVDFRQRPGRGGRPTLQAARVSYAGAVSLGVTPSVPGA